MNGCQKVYCGTQADAELLVTQTKMKSKEPPHRLALLCAYQCRVCNGWHIGHRTPRDEAHA